MKIWLIDFVSFHPKQNGKNLLQSSIRCFKKHVIDKPELQGATIIVLLNKARLWISALPISSLLTKSFESVQVDVFKEKLELRSIGDYFDDAPKRRKGRDFERALEYVKARFQKIGDKAGLSEQQFNIFATTAVDPENAPRITRAMVHRVFADSLSGWL